MYLAQPAWLLLLVLLPILGMGAVLVARLRRRQWNAFVAERLRPVLLRSTSPLARWFSLCFLLAASAALIIAMARPQGEAGTKAEKAIGRNILIALDLSRSMRVADVKPDRLAQAKVILYELLDAMPNERIGLIGFAGSAHLLAPLTIDHSAVRETIEQADENWVELGGSDFTNAIRLAIATLKETGQKNNALVILSDGDKHDEQLAPVIDQAKRAGVYIFAIGVGTDDGGFVPSKDFPNGRLIGPDGQAVLSRLQPATLRRFATETQGRFATADGGTDIPAMVKLAAKDLDAFEMKGRERQFVIEFYQWLVLPAVLFLFVSVAAGTRWRGVNTTAAVLVGGLLLGGPQCRAGDAAEAEALLARGQHQSARAAFGRLADESRFPERSARFSLGEATAAYRAKDFPAARAAYSRALLSESPEVTASAHFGLANSLFQTGWQTLAGSPYPTDPEALPDLPAFDEIVKERLAAILQAKPEPDQPTPGLGDLENLVINWADAVKHYDSALQAEPSNPDPKHNRETTLTFLKRLMSLLEQERQQAEESIPEPQPTPAPGNPGEEPSEGPGQKPDEQKNPDDGGKGDDQKENNGESNNKNPPDKGDEDGKPDDDDKTDDQDQPGKEPPQEPKDQAAEQADETPEETARRILGENTDLQKGPPRAGRHIQRTPKKDW